jgi:hypothetical protein
MMQNIRIRCLGEMCIIHKSTPLLLYLLNEGLHFHYI